MFRSLFARPAVPTGPARRAVVLETLEGRQLLSASGLTLVETKSTLPTAQLSGANLKGAVTVQVTNGLTTTISGPQTFNVYASADGTIDATSQVLGTLSRGNLKLGPAGSTKLTVAVNKAAPAVGEYAIFVQAIDSVGNTSVAAKAPDVSVAAPYVSLVATVGAPKPTAFTVNKPVTFKVTIVNNGNIDSRNTIAAAVELSTDRTTVFDTLGQPQVRRATVKGGGKAVTFTYKVKVTDTGTFYVGATFTSGVQVFTAFGTTPITVGSNAR